MSESATGVLFLKQKYNLHAAPEVAAAAKRTQIRYGEGVAQDPASRIENYLNRFREIIDRPDPEKRERGMGALKKVLHDKFVVKLGEIPESYWENQKRLVRERGQGADLEQVDWEQVKTQNSESIIADQKSSLDNWVDYLASNDATYPDWLKYWTVRNITDMGKYDKETKMFPRRSRGTTNPFPELNREALAYVLDVVEKKHTGTLNLIDLIDEDRKQFEQLLRGENFPKLYAWAIDKVTPASVEQLAVTDGRWVKYDKGSDHMPLVQSLQGHGTGWCTAGESTAQTQLQGGDFYVYYSKNQDGQAIIPRVAIRMEDDHIGEVRGVAPEQNLDPYIGTVVQNKLKEFPDGTAYEKKVSDMKRLTAIANKTKGNLPLTSGELIFLYEMQTSIEGFGYQRDPRIQELRGTRDIEKDMPIVFACTSEQIAHSREEITQNTKAYVGKLTPGIFDVLSPQVEHIYTSFPEKRITRESITIGGETTQRLELKLKSKNIQTSPWAQELLHSDEFTTLKNAEVVDVVKLQVSDLGFTDYPTTEQLYQRASELGLELCPAEVGPHYRLQYTDQPLHEWVYIGMKQITDSHGDPDVFGLLRDADGVWLDAPWGGPTYEWGLDDKGVFRRRKLKP